MTDNEKLSCLIDRPCSACKFHNKDGCVKWSCIFEEKSDVPEREKGTATDITECARAIKDYCVNRVSHNPTMCDECPIYKVMCEPDISCPYHWDLPESEDKE